MGVSALAKTYHKFTNFYWQFMTVALFSGHLVAIWKLLGSCLIATYKAHIATYETDSMLLDHINSTIIDSDTPVTCPWYNLDPHLSLLQSGHTNQWIKLKYLCTELIIARAEADSTF